MEGNVLDLECIQVSTQRILNHLLDVDNHKTYMVHSTLRHLSPSSFNPHVVSIGPYHKEDENVQASEGWKISYVKKLLSRINAPKEKVLELCACKVHASLKQIKACYVWTKTYDDAQIADMMVMDACFILEFMLKYLESVQKPYSGKLLLVQTILHDLVLLENQIPLFILDDIFQCTILTFNPKASLVELLLPILSCNNMFKADINIDNVSYNNAPHILGLLHQCYGPRVSNIALHSQSSTIHSVVDLPDKERVTFKPNKDPTWVMEMELESYSFPCLFWHWDKPTLRMPVLRVDDHTESVLRNLIAYEQLYESHKYVTSYLYAMGKLANTQEDVAKLVQSGVFINQMGSNEEVSNMIKNVIAGVDSLEWKTSNKYCNGLMRSSYFSSPWNMIALICNNYGSDHLWHYVRQKKHLDLKL